MQINDPDIVAELKTCHDAYENALIGNEVSTLDALFWDSPHAVRYGVTENLYGSAEIQAFRQGRPKINLAREVVRLEITALGQSAGIVNLEFKRFMNGVERHGRQTQFWIKFQEGWKIVSAHVSLMPAASSYVDAAAARVGLPIDAEYLGCVNEDMKRVADVAAFLMEFPLDQAVEAAPVFQP
jgi:hypothetical protein